ncbi:MAG TPA: protein kinase [Steroidobacteraceae bacterium]|jgi:serine/threonine protein kinase|nr:protein kinase [Steroidobacteraceae bacterium]
MTRQRRDPIEDSDSLEPDDLFHSIKSRLAQRAKRGEADGITVDLFPVAADPIPELDTPALPEPAGTELEVGEVLCGRYVIESQLASGGMGTVYKALDRSRSEHTAADAYVAIKVLHEKTRTRSDVLAKLRREFYCAQALSHRSVVKVYELDLHEFPFFTMEMIDGESLPNLMQKFHPLPLPRSYACAVIREVGEGLAHAHDRRVIHGDIKPQNVMVTNSGEVRILDFGTSGETVALTPAYASCELLEGREADPRDDLFALACLSYELLAGEHPFQHRRSTEARTLKISPSRPPGLSGRQWRALSRGLAWDRADRPASLRDWLADLDLGRDSLGPIPQPEDSKTSLLTRSGVASAAIALLAVTIVCGVTWAVLSRPKPAPSVADAAAAAEAEPPVIADSGPADADIDDTPPPAAAVPAPKTDLKAHNAAARPIDKTERIGMLATSYSFRGADKFAEIRVHRSTGSKAGTSFEWWTEPASALAGTDFAPQTPATVFFPAGVRTVSLFIKLVPNTARKRTALFYVVLGNTSSGSTLNSASKASISLHP